MTEDEMYDEVFAKGYELGKREAEQRIASEIERSQDRLRDRVILLETWLEGDAYCPCCTGVKECSEGCTFAEDDHEANERMLAVRDVLYGG